MLYSWTGREITDEARPIEQRLTNWEPADRTYTDESRGMTPTTLDAIFSDANQGSPEAQARLAGEIEEKDMDVPHALGTRRAAVRACRWRCEAEDEKNAQAVEIAAAAEKMLRSCTGSRDADEIGFEDLLGHLLCAILPGYAVAEILWGPGGERITGFAALRPAQVTYLSSATPLIVGSVSGGMGQPMAPNKFVFHRHSARSGDATRGGLVRPLGWMFLFAAQSVKSAVRFVEKFGLPFVSARLDDNAWQKDRTKIAYLIKNFGSDGGGVFSKAVELELLAAPTGNADMFLKLLEYFGDAKVRTILGQTASSGDAGGWSKGQAQSQVRQDILQSDASQLSATIKRDALRPWVAFNYGPDAPVPEFCIETDPPEDLTAQAATVKTLNESGYQADPEWVEKKFGIPLRKGPDGKPAYTPRAPAVPGNGTLALAERRRVDPAVRRIAAEQARAASDRVAASALDRIARDSALLNEWLGPLQEAIDEALASVPDDTPEADRKRLFVAALRRLVGHMPQLAEMMKTDRFEEMISQAMFAGDTNGRMAATAGL